MRKAQSLRSALASAIPEFGKEPGRLKIWIEDGSGKSRQTESFGFAFSYRLNVLAEEMRTDIALLALAIFRWLRVEQPDLLAPNATGFNFEADILDNKTADILIQIDISENVSVRPVNGGGFTLEYLPEPDPLFEGMLGAGNVNPIPDLAAIVLDPVEPVE